MTPRLLVFAVFLALTSGSVLADTADVEQRLRRAIDETIAIAEGSPTTAILAKKVRAVVVDNMSFPAMTRRAIGPGWRKFTPDQQERAVALFTELIIRRYSARFVIGEHPSVVYKTATIPAPGRVEIPTMLTYKGSRHEVIYRMEQAEGWRITDVVVEGVSFIANYRSQFDEHYQKGGPDAVLNALENAVKRPE